ncbi:MAG: methionine gamma-lyase [Anaerolineales bacterium]|nr:aminotransferase class I/II-fold pyridoxal phosphate-dependent enzyme [Anaerolineae bacterium]PWB49454.1 MAG: methionine gamma-lyase [Anaerolineales bacterium]
MYQYLPNHSIGTLAIHVGEDENPHHSHVSPIYQTSTFNFTDVATGAGIVARTEPGYYYTRLANPNLDQLAQKIAYMEGLDLLRAQPGVQPADLVAGQVFSSGMAAITAVLLSKVKAGDTIVAQEAVYSATFTFLKDIAPSLGIQVSWVHDTSPSSWVSAFDQHPNAKLAYAETPANPTMAVVELKPLAELAHQHGAWLAVDNTFASPYCQRPLSLGADIVMHSTTKFLSGHGTLTGGAVVSSHPAYIHDELFKFVKILGGIPSPFDAWLANLGLKTFELRMQRHCENALQVAHFLSSHPAVAEVHYPGLEGDPGHEIATRQMHAYGGMLSFELKGGMQAGIRLMERVKLATLAVSLGMVDTLIEHPASMTHGPVAKADRLNQGITDGLVRLSVGVENLADILADLEQGLR